jgi:hypothetical protein
MPRAPKPSVANPPAAVPVASEAVPENPSADEREAQRVEARFVAIRQEYGAAWEMRLRKNYKIWWSGKDLDEKKATITKEDKDELRRFGVLPVKVASEGADPTAKYPALVSQTQMAAIISEQFSTKVDKVTLSRLRKEAWIKPCVGVNNRWKPELTLRLWEENMGGKKENESEAELRREKLRIDKETAQENLDEIRRLKDETWMKKADAQNSTTAAVLLHHSFVKNRLKDFTRRLSKDLFTEIQLEKIKEACSRVLEEIETDCEEYK